MTSEGDLLPSSIAPAQLTGARRVWPLAVAMLMSATLVAGCGGGSRNKTTATQGSAAGPSAVTTVVTGAAPRRAAPSGAALYCGDVPCYSPQQFLVAYGIAPLLNSRIDGRGETVTIVAPVPLPNEEATDIRQDLESFDTRFQLPAARIEVVTSLGGSASPWQATGEEAGDTAIVHAVAPAAKLRVVMIPSSWGQSAANGTADMLAALRLATSDTDVASISWSIGEHYFTATQVAEMHSILSGAAARHVTVVGSSGDEGDFSDDRWGPRVKEVSLPASDPLVLGAGGTTLTANRSTGAYLGETAWTGSGGGFSHVYARPAYQDGVPAASKTRGVPDVAGDAAEVGGMARIEAKGGEGYPTSAEGTSNSAPLWGGLMALADQYAHHDLGFVNAIIYRIGRSPSYHRAFHDITTGTNGYSARPGWDPVTGWGSPDAQVLVPLLDRFAGLG